MFIVIFTFAIYSGNLPFTDSDPWLAIFIASIYLSFASSMERLQRFVNFMLIRVAYGETATRALKAAISFDKLQVHLYRRDQVPHTHR